jgi:hypothetical protein
LGRRHRSRQGQRQPPASTSSRETSWSPKRTGQMDPHAEGRKSAMRGRKMTATPKWPIPLKTKQIARNAKNGPPQRPICAQRGAQRATANRRKTMQIARNSLRNKTCLRCGVAPFPFLGKAHAQQAQRFLPIQPSLGPKLRRYRAIPQPRQDTIPQINQLVDRVKTSARSVSFFSLGRRGFIRDVRQSDSRSESVE